MPRKILAVAACLVLGTAPGAMAAGGGGGGGGGHGFGGYRGYSGGGYGRGYGYGRYGRGFGYGGYGLGFGLYGYPYYGNGYGPTDASGDITSATPPPVWFVPELPRTPIVCKETVTVPSEDGGTRQITIRRC